VLGYSGAQVPGAPVPGAPVPGALVPGALVPGDLLPIDDHGCVFHDAVGHRCRIHDTHGHNALPVACQQFPRVSVIDPRGASVTLSCFCPTAAAMLEEWNGDIQVISHTSHVTSEGLDARTSLPPALRPDVLTDWESWWEFERLAVEEFNRDETPRKILANLSEIVERVRTWRPGEGELIERVRSAFASDLHREQSRVRKLPEHPAPEHPGTSAPAHRRFLACHAFASWTAHLGSGLRTWLRSLETVLFLLEQGWTMKEIDHWLRHYADPRRLAAAWSSAESARSLH
jgi:hypothetical protein